MIRGKPTPKAAKALSINKKSRDKRPAFRVGDRVVRNRAVGGKQSGNMLGTVRRVTGTPFGSGGTRARVRVLWDNGYEGSVEDRQILPVGQRPRNHLS